MATHHDTVARRPDAAAPTGSGAGAVARTSFDLVELPKQIAAITSTKVLAEVERTFYSTVATGGIDETEAEAIGEALSVRRAALTGRALPTSVQWKTPSNPAPALTGEGELPELAASKPPRRRGMVGSRPRTAESISRRRRWASSGWMPPSLAAGFTLAEAAALAVIAAEVTGRKRCTLAIGAIAGMAGVSPSTVRAALRVARRLGLVLVEERRRSATRSDTNVVTIVDPGWTAWLTRGRRSGWSRTHKSADGLRPLVALPGLRGGGGYKSPLPASTNLKVRSALAREGLPRRKREGDLAVLG